MQAFETQEDTQVSEIVESCMAGAVIFGRYRVGATLGVGGFGRVVRAHDLDRDEPVAIKLLRDAASGQAIERFLREAQAASRLHGQHVARIRDVGRLHGGSPFIVMELLDGFDLGWLHKERGLCDPTFAVDLLLQVCDALAEAHAHGIVHRDIKPSNLFLARRADGSEVLKILDFGIAKLPLLDTRLTSSQALLGTPMYMSPEQARCASSVDARTDVWSLGAVLYELVEGRPPFEAESVAEICVRVATEDPAPMQRCAQLQHVIDRCLQKHPDDRFQDVAELAAALAPHASAAVADRYVDSIAHMLGAAAPRPRASFWRRSIAATVVAAACAMAIAVASPSPSTRAPRWQPPALPVAPVAAPIRAAVVDVAPASEPTQTRQVRETPPQRPKLFAKRNKPRVAVESAVERPAEAPAPPKCNPFNSLNGGC